MFVFLSKLVPLFLYPVGLSSLLLVIAIASFWKRPRLAAGCIAFALGILFFCSNPALARAIVQSLELQYLPPPTPPQAEAIVILGGSTHAPVPPRTWPEIMEQGDRILYGAKLYREGAAPKIILSGGRINWGGPTVQSEAADMRTLLRFMEVPDTALYLDSTSLNTHQNAVNVKVILEQAGINGPVLLVTSALHMPRSMAIFKKQGIPAIAAPTDYLYETGNPYQSFGDILFDCLPTAKAVDQVTNSLKEYLGFLIYGLRGWL